MREGCSLNGFGQDGEAFYYKFDRTPVTGDMLAISDCRAHVQKLYRVLKVTWGVDRWIPGFPAEASLQLELIEEKHY